MLELIATVHVPDGATVKPVTVNVEPFPVDVVAFVDPAIDATPAQPLPGVAVNTVDASPFVAETLTVCCVPSDAKFIVIVLSCELSNTTGL